MRRTLVAFAACLSMLAVPAAAQAAEPDDAVPPAFLPPAPAPVVDDASAEAFAERYASRNAGRFIGTDRRRTRTVDVAARCLQSPIVATRWGCVFTLRALVIQRRHNWRNWDGPHASKSSQPRRRVRIRNYGCLGFLRINGGPTVTPTAQAISVECARLPRRDLVAPEPV